MGAQQHAEGLTGKRLRSDARLRAELELCDRWGIPHSHFLGAGDGTWTARDREKALAYAEFTRATCSGCGTRGEEWDRDAGGDRHAYVTTTWRCPGCEAIAQEQDQVPDGEHGVKVGLIPLAVAQAQEHRQARKKR